MQEHGVAASKSAGEILEAVVEDGREELDGGQHLGWKGPYLMYANETSTLVRQEVNLTKVEMSDKVAEKAFSRQVGG